MFIWEEFIVFYLEKEGYAPRKEMILRKTLDGTGGLFTTGWPQAKFYRLMDNEEAGRRKSWSPKTK